MFQKRRYWLYDSFNRERLVGKYKTPERAREAAHRLYNATQGACICTIYRLGVSGQQVKYLEI